MISALFIVKSVPVKLFIIIALIALPALVELYSSTMVSPPSINQLYKTSSSSSVHNNQSSGSSGSSSNSRSQKPFRFFIAANLYNSQEILPHWTLEMARLIKMLGGGDAVHISIYESFSQDRTKEMLHQWRKDFLIPNGIPHDLHAVPDNIRDKPKFGQLEDERIKFLADMRNRAMRPFYRILNKERKEERRREKMMKDEMKDDMKDGMKDQMKDEKADMKYEMKDGSSSSSSSSSSEPESTAISSSVKSTWKWINYGNRMQHHRSSRSNISSSSSSSSHSSQSSQSSSSKTPFTHVLFINDILFLAEEAMKLLVETNGGSFDMACAMDFFNAGFYDRWVTRDINGRIMSLRFPFVREDKWSQEQIYADSFLPVYSCWNGMVWLRAEPFIVFGERNLAFRGRKSRAECFSSECFLLAKDLHSFGYHSIFMHSGKILILEYNWSNNLDDFLGIRVAYQLGSWLLWRQLLSSEIAKFIISPKSGLFPSIHVDGLIEKGPHMWEDEYECISWPNPT